MPQLFCITVHGFLPRIQAQSQAVDPLAAGLGPARHARERCRKPSLHVMSKSEDAPEIPGRGQQISERRVLHAHRTSTAVLTRSNLYHVVGDPCPGWSMLPGVGEGDAQVPETLEGIPPPVEQRLSSQSSGGLSTLVAHYDPESDVITRLEWIQERGMKASAEVAMAYLAAGVCGMTHPAQPVLPANPGSCCRSASCLYKPPTS